MSPPLVCHGWTIAFQPQLFARQYAELKAEVRRLKQELDPPASWVCRIATACSFALLKRKASACY